MKSIRIDKFLADMQIGTRSQVKQLLKKRLVTVNGETVKKPEIKVDPDNDRVFFDGRLLTFEKEIYYMLNKPAGVVSATEDRREKTVLDLLSKEDHRPDLFPVGRLDKDTVGLLLLTNDGPLSHHLLSPRHHVDKTYQVRVDGDITQETVQAFEQGLDIGDEKMTLPAKLEPVAAAGTATIPTTPPFPWHEAKVTIHEGRFHQIKRMFHATDCEVTWLKRLSMGSLKLDETLEEGCYRRLTAEEIEALRNI